MWLRSVGPSATSRSRRPGQYDSSRSIASIAVVASTSTCRVRPGKSGVSVPGRRTSVTSVQHGHVDRGDPGEIAGDLVPRIALVRAREHLAGARAEVEAGDVVRVDYHRLPEHAEVGVLLREPLPHRLPTRAGVTRAVDRRLAVVHRPPV